MRQRLMMAGLVWTIGALTCAAQGQVLRDPGAQPGNPGDPGGVGLVDQAVGDLDALSTSLRRVERGIARFDAGAALYRLPERPEAVGLLPAPGGQRYLFEAPGFRAYLDRPAYLVIGRPDTGPAIRRNVSPGIDGGYLPVIPANTVFDLRPRPPRGPVMSPATDGNWVDRRLGTRLGPIAPVRVDGPRVDRSLTDGVGGNRDLTPIAEAPKPAAAAGAGDVRAVAPTDIPQDAEVTETADIPDDAETTETGNDQTGDDASSASPPKR